MAPPLQAAHLLTQAAKSLCRARFSSYEACAEGSVPVYAPLRHLQLALPGSSGYAWQQLVAQQVFGAFKSRLAADRLSLSRPAERDALDACAQQLAQVKACLRGGFGAAAAAAAKWLRCELSSLQPYHPCCQGGAPAASLCYCLEASPRGHRPSSSSITVTPAGACELPGAAGTQRGGASAG